MIVKCIGGGPIKKNCPLQNLYDSCLVVINRQIIKKMIRLYRNVIDRCESGEPSVYVCACKSAVLTRLPAKSEMGLDHHVGSPEKNCFGFS